MVQGALASYMSEYMGVCVAHSLGVWCREWPQWGEQLPAAATWRRQWPWGVAQGAQGGMAHGCVAGGAAWPEGMPRGVLAGCMVQGGAQGCGAGWRGA